LQTKIKLLILFPLNLNDLQNPKYTDIKLLIGFLFYISSGVHLYRRVFCMRPWPGSLQQRSTPCTDHRCSPGSACRCTLGPRTCHLTAWLTRTAARTSFVPTTPPPPVSQQPSTYSRLSNYKGNTVLQHASHAVLFMHKETKLLHLRSILLDEHSMVSAIKICFAFSSKEKP